MEVFGHMSKKYRLLLLLLLSEQAKRYLLRLLCHRLLWVGVPRVPLCGRIDIKQFSVEICSSAASCELLFCRLFRSSDVTQMPPGSHWAPHHIPVPPTQLCGTFQVFHIAKFTAIKRNLSYNQCPPLPPRDAVVLGSRTLVELVALPTIKKFSGWRKEIASMKPFISWRFELSQDPWGLIYTWIRQAKVT
jgi:hypothetical protein